MHAMTSAIESLPPRHGCSSAVSLLLRKGTWWWLPLPLLLLTALLVAAARAWMTSPRALRLRLIAWASFRLSPAERDFATRSDPARSTTSSRALVPRCAMVMDTNACDRELAALLPVPRTCRSCAACATTEAASEALATARRVRPTTSAPLLVTRMGHRALSSCIRSTWRWCAVSALPRPRFMRGRVSLSVVADDAAGAFGSARRSRAVSRCNSNTDSSTWKRSGLLWWSSW
mmetsp:Transcript_40246/g.124378  ORF Transcript_40246/g.124378 Transcript_40246/m.124378 type:complete len:232 (+) Transcript_40246:455-1150(+)